MSNDQSIKSLSSSTENLSEVSTPEETGIKLILMDIEGTTTAISFVHDTLFPFARKRMRSFVEEHGTHEDVIQCICDVKETALQELKKDLSDSDAINLLIQWIDEDRKHGALKKLQGMIWRYGFEDGSIKGHFYKDVPSYLEAWLNAGYTLGVYSSGSVQAQKLLYRFSEYGDLSSYIKYHFDTAVGHKREAESYQAIIKELNASIALSSDQILFLSDIAQELDAAKATGMHTVQLQRQPIEPGVHLILKDFTEIKLDVYKS